MPVTEYQISHHSIRFLFDTPFAEISRMVPPEQCIIITDENIASLYPSMFDGYRLIVIAPGETNKNRKTADHILDQLIEMEADRSTLLIGVGGGMVTDLAGYAASLFKRGMRLGLVPTSVLGMVDAALGGKNGINAGLFKNIIGSIYQPEFILFDFSFLKTLPRVEWESGFAEIIKHACIKSKQMFETLERFTLHDFQSDLSLLSTLIEENIKIKMLIVQQDLHDRDERLLLNFGHTIGHAVENLHHLPHGHAISIGMVAACNLSEKSGLMHFDESARVVKLLSRYHLPVDLETEPSRIFDILKMDKKREQGMINFIMLNGIGNGKVKPVELKFLEENLAALL